MSAEDVFIPDVIDAISRHMNGDHADDNVLIVRGLGSVDEATTATMTGMNPDGIVFDAVTPGGTVTVQIPFAHPIVERVDVRHEVVRMYADACATLGVEPREEAR